MRFVRNDDFLQPFDQDTRQWVRQLGLEAVTLEQVHDRDPIFHRKTFAFMNDLAKALGTAPELVRAELLWKTGNFLRLGRMFGVEMIALNSMSRRKMRDHELRLFWADAKKVIVDEMLPRISDDTVRDHLSSQLLLQEACS
jgi:hypothetical protein